MPKVHILSDTEANKELGEEVMKLLKKSKGPLSYKTSSLEIKEDTHRVVEFEDLFDICKNFRENSNAVKPYSVKPNDFVILLSPKPNMKNWFSALDFKNNIFVHTDGWDKYCEQQPKFPIAHEIISNIVHSKLFENKEALVQGVHYDTLGCINDFCDNKEQVIEKLKSGDVCEACLIKINDTFEDSPGFLGQISSTLHSISIAFTRLAGIVAQKPISSIEINGTKELKFTDYNNKELKFESAIDKVLYILFLKHKDGLEYVDFPDMELEITELYFKHVPSNKGLAKIEKTISNLCMPLSELRNQAKSRVNGRLEATLGSTLAVHYKIVQNPETLVHSIKLPAEFRVFKD
jgi:hypothetical protein|tara:strand:- start:488 stop:1534 length:1047 start_codon:yes stop_codon:yes gene_type:complete